LLERSTEQAVLFVCTSQKQLTIMTTLLSGRPSAWSKIIDQPVWIQLPTPISVIMIIIIPSFKRHQLAKNW